MTSTIAHALRVAGHQIGDCDATSIADGEQALTMNLMAVESAAIALIDQMANMSRAITVASDIVTGHSPAWAALTVSIQQSLVSAIRLAASIDTAIISEGPYHD